MATCIYGRKKNWATSVSNGEHVIPRELGTFETNQTLTHNRLRELQRQL
jgi:hypothetical protein